MDDVTRMFVQESAGSMNRMRTLLATEHGLSEANGAVEDLYCAVHTVKGACGFLGLRRIESVATAGERLLFELKNGRVRCTTRVENGLVSLTDALSALLEKVAESGTDGDDGFEELVGELEALAAGHAGEDAPADATSAGTDAVGSTDGRQALVIDDSRAMRRLLARVMQGLGFAVVEAASGEEALAVLARAGRLPEVVLVDWTLPEMDGVEVVRAVRGIEGLSGVPVVMVTSETAPHQVEQAFAAGVDRYVTKPFTKDKIVEAVAGLGLVT